MAGLTWGPGGALYGTTSFGGNGPCFHGPYTSPGCGTVFKLVPPAAGMGAWTETVLYRFKGGADGGDPGGLTRDLSGALYGTADFGTSRYGVVFRLTPPAAGKTAWTETVLYTFKGGADGGIPGGLIRDPSGALYGTTSGGGTVGNGTVFKLTPPGAGKTAWTETVLYRFKGGTDGSNPGGLIRDDPSGTLYGTTSGVGTVGNGTVFKLTPPGAGKTAWTETVLYSFTGGADGSNPGGLIRDPTTGALYGTTGEGGDLKCSFTSAPIPGCGVVFKLTPPALGKTAWTETVLHTFAGGTDGSGPLAGPIRDPTGPLYGTTAAGGTTGDGTVFKLTPPAAGKTAWAGTGP
jgi:uncharacterized repeat protein (TIGR03803 family)